MFCNGCAHTEGTMKLTQSRSDMWGFGGASLEGMFLWAQPFLQWRRDVTLPDEWEGFQLATKQPGYVSLAVTDRVIRWLTPKTQLWEAIRSESLTHRGITFIKKLLLTSIWRYHGLLAGIAGGVSQAPCGWLTWKSGEDVRNGQRRMHRTWERS